MNTLKLTKNDFKDTNSYYKEYIGKTDVSNYEGHIEIEGNLGWVKFNGSLRATGRIFAEAGSGIKAGLGIEAGSGIKAGWGIKAGEGIKAGTGIKAGSGIEAGLGIEAGSGIKAGEGIKAGTGIEAGWGIEAGLSITCKLAISWGIKMFAGICCWREIKEEEKTITCGKLEPKDGAVVEYGIVKELGMPNEKPSLSGKTVKVELDGVSYEAIIK